MILCIGLLFSCINDNLEDCYNAQITYRYTREGSSKNIIQGYVRSVKEYIFDGRGVLYMINVLPEKASVSSHKLPPGEYTLISWGNHADISNLSNIEIGKTTKEDVFMYMNKGTTGNAERLFYAYRTFTVSERGTSFIHADMVQAYSIMNLTVKWRSSTPDNSKDFYFLYKQVPSAYSFTPRYVLEKNNWSPYTSGRDVFPYRSEDKICYTPKSYPEDDLTIYRQDVKINVDKKIKASFVTYRYTNDSPLLLSLYWGDEQIMKELALDRFFKETKTELDKELHQEYSLEIEIDGDRVTVSFIDINDWENGGDIN